MQKHVSEGAAGSTRNVDVVQAGLRQSTLNHVPSGSALKDNNINRAMAGIRCNTSTISIYWSGRTQYKANVVQARWKESTVHHVDLVLAEVDHTVNTVMATREATCVHVSTREVGIPHPIHQSRP